MLSVLSLKVPRESENSPEQTAQLLASLSRSTKKFSGLKKLFGKTNVHLALEITLIEGQINFCVVAPTTLVNFVKSQLSATYPDVTITEATDYLPSWTKPDGLAIIKQTAPAYFPLRDYADYKEVDPMLPLLGVLAKTNPDDKILIQFILSPANGAVAARAQHYITPHF